MIHRPNARAGVKLQPPAMALVLTWLCMASSSTLVPLAARSADAPPASNVTLVPLIHPEWDGVWLAAPGTTDDKYTPFELASRKAHGAHVPSESPPLKPEFLSAYQDRIKQMIAGKPVVDPVVAECLPLGMPRMMLTSHRFRLSVMPTKMVWYTAWGSQPRQLYLDGRVHPSDDDIDLTFRGESIAHWAGDTLVIDTKGFTKRTLVDGTGVPHGERMHIVEHVKMTNPKTLEWTIAVDDPDYFTAPWVTTMTYVRAATSDIGDEYSCSAERSHGSF